MKCRTKKIAANLPLDVLEEASSLSGLNQTQTIIQGLKELIRKEKLNRFLALKGKLDIKFDPTVSRERK